MRRWAELLERIGAGEGSGQGQVCRLTLVWLGAVPPAEAVRWGGGAYLTAAANLWAHRVSPHPPRWATPRCVESNTALPC